MTTFAYSSGNPSNLVGGHAASMTDIAGPLTDIPTFLNGNIDTANLATSAKPVTVAGPYRTIQQISAIVTFGIAASTRFAYNNGSTGTATITSGTALSTTESAIMLYLDPADYALSGLTTKFRLSCALATNATAPAITFTFGLYPVTVAGATNTLAVTLGTVVAGSTVAMVTPSASTVTPAVGTDFTPPAAGAYALGVVFSGAIAANATSTMLFSLQYHHV